MWVKIPEPMPNKHLLIESSGSVYSCEMSREHFPWLDAPKKFQGKPYTHRNKNSENTEKTAFQHRTKRLLFWWWNVKPAPVSKNPSQISPETPRLQAPHLVPAGDLLLTTSPSRRFLTADFACKFGIYCFEYQQEHQLLLGSANE